MKDKKITESVNIDNQQINRKENTVHQNDNNQ